MKKIEVVAGIIRNEGYFLCVQRPYNKSPHISKKFEFPGGKIEPQETRQQALNRELKEELNLDVPIKDYYMTVEYNYPHFELIMHSYFVDVDTKEIILNEHISHQWLTRENLLTLDWAAADLPIVYKLMKDE